MNFAIGSIDWPKNNHEAVRLYLGYVIKVLDALNIKYSHHENDPLEMARAYVAGEISPEKCQMEAMVWWKKIDDQAAIRDFQNKEALMARLAICLLHLKVNDTSDLGEDLSWFIEVLSFMGADVDLAINIMAEYFSAHIKK